jgi:SAM-dependent methyltransferase
MTVSNEAARNEFYLGQRETNDARCIRRPSFRLSDIWKAPLNDFPIRDEILYQYLPLSTGMDVLEIGPGSGFTAFRLARQLRSLTLLDVAAQSLAVVRKQLGPLANVRCVCADPTRPGLAAELKQEFDAAFALDVFEYLVDPATCLRNLAQVLRPNGELFLTYPNVPPPAGDGVTYFSHASNLADLLLQTGFRHSEIFAVRRRPFPQWVYMAVHEHPLHVYRWLRNGNPNGHPQTYEASWVFNHLEKLQRYKVPLHLFWLLLARVMRLGGDVFAPEHVSDGILGRQLVIRAWKG